VKNNKFNFGLILLLLISFFVRIYRINTLSLFGDEIDVGYQAYSLLNTGKDYKGNFLPIYIQSLSESRAPLFIYFSIPGVAVFGLTELGVRITPILFGVLSIYLLYKLIFLFSKSSNLALFCSLALSFSPWHFHYSRTAFEVTLLLSLTLAAIYFFQKFIQSPKTAFLYLSIIFFGLTFYTYNTANIFTPLIVVYLLITNRQKIFTNINPKKIIISLGLTLLFILPIFTQILSGRAANRFGLISIFNDQKTISHIIDQRTSLFATNPKIERVFYNKATAWTSVFFQNYLESISPIFLFNKGDTNNLRHNLPQFGLLFLAFTPLFFIGLIKTPKDKLQQLMLFWLLISPIASALTIQGGHHPTRLFLMLPPLVYFIGQGITILFSSKLISKIIFIIISLAFVFEVSFYSHEYFYKYPKENFKPWDYGYKEIFTSLSQMSYNRLLISNSNFNSLLPYLFYNRISPTVANLNDHENKNLIADMPGFSISNDIYFINNWKHVINYYNEIFNKLDQVSQTDDILVLFQLNEIPGDIDLSQKPREGYQTIKTIYNPDKTILAQILKKI